jgi:hypothetical protein
VQNFEDSYVIFLFFGLVVLQFLMQQFIGCFKPVTVQKKKKQNDVDVFLNQMKTLMFRDMDTCIHVYFDRLRQNMLHLHYTWAVHDIYPVLPSIGEKC